MKKKIHILLAGDYNDGRLDSAGLCFRGGAGCRSVGLKGQRLGQWDGKRTGTADAAAVPHG